MKPEQKLYHLFKKNCPKISITRLEVYSTQGVPDLLLYNGGGINRNDRFLYLELKEKKARFKNFWAQQREIDSLTDKNNELEKKNKELSSVIVNNVRADLKTVRI